MYTIFGPLSFTNDPVLKLADHPEPEMMRLSLSDLALRIKILKVKLGTSIEDVLSKALDPPSPVNIQRAVAALIEVSDRGNPSLLIATINAFAGESIDIRGRDHADGPATQQDAHGRSSGQIPASCCHYEMLGSRTDNRGYAELQITLYDTLRAGRRG